MLVANNHDLMSQHGLLELGERRIVERWQIDFAELDAEVDLG